MRLTFSFPIPILVVVVFLLSFVLSGPVGVDSDTAVDSTTTLHSTVTVTQYDAPSPKPWASLPFGGPQRWHGWQGFQGGGNGNHPPGFGPHSGGYQILKIRDIEGMPDLIDVDVDVDVKPFLSNPHGTNTGSIDNPSSRILPTTRVDLPTTTFVRSTISSTESGTKTVPDTSHTSLVLFMRTPPCQAGYNICSDAVSCCPDGTYCRTDVTGTFGCCPVGATCTGLVGNSGAVSVTLLPTSTDQPFIPFVTNAAGSNARPARFFGLFTCLVKVKAAAREPDTNVRPKSPTAANHAAGDGLAKRMGHGSGTHDLHAPHHHHRNAANFLRPRRMFGVLVSWLSVGTASRRIPDTTNEIGGSMVKVTGPPAINRRQLTEHQGRANVQSAGQKDDVLMGVVEVPCDKAERDVDGDQGKNANEALGLGSALVSAWGKAKAIWSQA